jgi:hypothetical protein
MKTVPLGGKKAAGRVALIDDGDYDLVMQYQWHVQEQPRPGRTHGPYAMASIGEGQRILMHKLLTGWLRTDHKDGNGLNNQRSNLREATGSQNQCNTGPRGGSSRFKGVSWDRATGNWRANIQIDGKGRNLGRFADEEAAARAYDSAAAWFHGEFAHLNFPLETPTEWHGRVRQRRPRPSIAGEGHARALLTEAAVIEIRRQHSLRTATLKELGERYGVSLSAIWMVVHRKTWSHVA